MGRYFIHLAYNGANYHGWQTQLTTSEEAQTASVQSGLATVQQTLEKALSTLLRQKIAVVGCGRTDSGVHASDFYAHFDVDESFLTFGLFDSLTFKLNSFLPPDIAIFNIFPVADNAHARFDAIARTYQYHVSDRRLPFRQGLYSRIYFRPDVERMNEAARVLMEYEDFTSFAKLHTQVKTNICHLMEACWEEVPLSPADSFPNLREQQYEWVFTIRSNRFLRNMVRSVTGTLLDVGRGKLSIDGLRQIIEKKDRCAAGVSMPACGLFLTKVEYPIKTIGTIATIENIEQ